MPLNNLQGCNNFYAFDYVDVGIATASIAQLRQLGEETPILTISWRWSALPRLFVPDGGILTFCAATALELLETDVL